MIVFVSNIQDERGQWTSSGVVHNVRNIIFKALLGWNLDERGNPITYYGGTLLDVNRYELTYQFDFVVDTKINSEETRIPDDLEDADRFGDLRLLAIDIDFIDHASKAPDSNIEHHIELNLPAPTKA